MDGLRIVTRSGKSDTNGLEQIYTCCWNSAGTSRTNDDTEEASQKMGDAIKGEKHGKGNLHVSRGVR